MNPVGNLVGNAALNDQSRLQVGDSRTEIHNYNEPNRNQCLADLRLTDPRDDKARIEQTKGGLLKDSYKWIFQHADYQRWYDDDDEESRLLLVSGDAGKGKTMLLCGMIDEISSQLAAPSLDTGKRKAMLIGDTIQRLSRKKSSNTAEHTSLLSFFFCQGSDSRLNSATAVLRGLIYLLLVQQETLALHLRKRYEHAHRLFDDTNAFYTLSQVLVEILQDPSLRGAYLIIDGLDECQAGLPQLLDFIVRNTSIPRVKWIVSSRNRYDIQQRLYLNSSRIRLSLEGNADDVSHAVEVYIDYKLSRLTSLKNNKSLQDQVRHQMRQKANGTFLWAALVFQELQEVQTWDVLRVVEELPADLVPLYDRMAKQIQQLKRQDYEFCQLVLSTVALSFRPLRLLELGILSGLPGWMIPSIPSIVEMCGSFLTIKDDYIYLIHQSANDYLRTNAPAAIFPPGSRDVHHRIFSQSLQAMSILRRDMYNLCHPGISIDQAPKVPPDADSLATVRYACVYWVDHLSRVKTGSSQYQRALCNDGDVHVFLRDFFLYWFEALSLMGRMSDGVDAITKLVKLLEGVSSESKAVKLARDAWSFILLNRAVVENTPLQAYASALLFSEAHNLIGELFRREEPGWITIVERSGTPDRHAGSVNAVVFSHDSHWLVSASDDRTVRVWDAETGRCLKTFKGHTESVRSVTFSHDSRRLASASDDTTVRIWDAEEGCCLKTFKGHTESVRSVTFSHDSKQLASASADKTVRIWDAEKGCCLETFKGHTKSVRSVTFSHDSRRLASASDDKTVRVWDAEKGCCLRTFKGHTESVRSVTFSHDSKQLASASNDKTLRIWDTETGKCLPTRHVGASLHTISFYHHDSCLLTDIGLLLLDSSISSVITAAAVPREPRRYGYGLGSNKSWITWHGQNVLWLPSEYRPISSAISEHAIAVGCSSGRVVVMMFSASHPGTI